MKATSADEAAIRRALDDKFARVDGTSAERARATMQLLLNGEPACGTCDAKCPLSGGPRCTLAPGHVTAHRARAWSWDNVETGAKAEHEGRTW